MLYSLLYNAYYFFCMLLGIYECSSEANTGVEKMFPMHFFKSDQILVVAHIETMFEIVLQIGQNFVS